MSAARLPWRRALALAVCGSVLVHLLGYLALRWAGTLPDVGFQIELPSHVEFGLADGTPLPNSPPSASAITPPAANAAPTNEPSAGPTPAPPKPKPKKKKPRPAPDAGPAPIEQAPDAGAPIANISDTHAPALAAYAPVGAQLALRVDMDRVRVSELSADVRNLLDAIPDFDALLGGSGVQPVDDLARLFLASPNLERSSLVVAGSYHGDDSIARKAVAALAQACGKPAAWRKRGGIAVAPWRNADSTERVLALIAPSLFAITRPDDLPRVLAVAHALSARDRKAHAASGADPASAGLLAMEDDELVALSVENAKSFVHGQVDNVPVRVRVSIRTPKPGVIEVVATGEYETATVAESARVFWLGVRDQFARHPLVAIVGMSEPLREMTLEAHDTELTSHATLSVEQARAVLGFATAAVTPRRSAPPAP